MSKEEEKIIEQTLRQCMGGPLPLMEWLQKRGRRFASYGEERVHAGPSMEYRWENFDVQLDYSHEAGCVTKMLCLERTERSGYQSVFAVDFPSLVITLYDGSRVKSFLEKLASAQ